MFYAILLIVLFIVVLIVEYRKEIVFEIKLENRYLRIFRQGKLLKTPIYILVADEKEIMRHDQIDLVLKEANKKFFSMCKELTQ